MVWDVSGCQSMVIFCNSSGFIGMGTLHAWESFGDGVAPDIQAVAKGLGGG